MDGSPITQDRAAGEQKKAAPLMRGEVVGGGAVVLLILFIYFLSRDLGNALRLKVGANHVLS